MIIPLQMCWQTLRRNRQIIKGTFQKSFKDLREGPFVNALIGVTGFEPAISRPPAVRSNQTEPYPVVYIWLNKMILSTNISIYNIFLKVKSEAEIILNVTANSSCYG